MSDVAHGPLVSRGNYNGIAKIHQRNLKIIFSRTTESISNKLDAICLCVSGTQVFFRYSTIQFSRIFLLMLWHNHCFERRNCFWGERCGPTKKSRGFRGWRELVNLTNAELRDITMHVNIILLIVEHVIYPSVQGRCMCP